MMLLNLAEITRCGKTLFTSFGLGRFKGAQPYIVLARIHSQQIARALTCANAENAATVTPPIAEQVASRYAGRPEGRPLVDDR